jgi:hypothetical protein
MLRLDRTVSVLSIKLQRHNWKTFERIEAIPKLKITRLGHSVQRPRLQIK